MEREIAVNDIVRLKDSEGYNGVTLYFLGFGPLESTSGGSWERVCNILALDEKSGDNWTTQVYLGDLA